MINSQLKLKRSVIIPNVNKNAQTMVQNPGFVTDGEYLTVTHIPVVVMDG